MKTFLRILFLCVWTACLSAANAEERGTSEQAVALVHKVVLYIQAHGKDKAIAAVNGGQFRERDLYITINSTANLNYAHGGNPRMIGKDLSDMKDIDGRYFMRERAEILKTKSSGWHEYKFVNPVNKQIEKKRMYFERVGDLVVACGVYSV